MSLLALLLPLVQLPSACRGEAHVFGKYFFGARDFQHNTYHLYKPAVASPVLSPVIFQVYGNAWANYPKELGPFRTITPAIKKYNANGIAFVSTAHRTVDVSYNYVDTAGIVQEEELIHIGKDGELTLDTAGKTMTQYGSMLVNPGTDKTDIPREAYITKCVYDVVQSLEHLILNSQQLGVDVHRIIFLATSAGTAEVNYLAFRYHKWNVGRFTPMAMVLGTPQFNLPILGFTRTVWKDFREHTVMGTKASSLFAFYQCQSAVRRVFWNRFCPSEVVYDTVTLQTLESTVVWNHTITGFSEGLEKLWLTSKMMMEHVPKPFHMFVSNNPVGAPDDYPFQHHPLYVQQYAEFADTLGINYTAYYNSYNSALQDYHKPHFHNAVEWHFFEDPGYPKWYYASSAGWYDKFVPVRALHPDEPGLAWLREHRLFVCYIFGIQSCGPAQSTTFTSPPSTTPLLSTMPSNPMLVTTAALTTMPLATPLLATTLLTTMPLTTPTTLLTTMPGASAPAIPVVTTIPLPTPQIVSPGAPVALASPRLYDSQRQKSELATPNSASAYAWALMISGLCSMFVIIARAVIRGRRANLETEQFSRLHTDDILEENALMCTTDSEELVE